jgi:plastocyanin
MVGYHGRMEFRHTTGKYIIWLALLAVAALGIYLASSYWQVSPSQTVATDMVEPPPFTEEIAAQLAASDGFEALVSYTDQGFEPESVTVEAGDTVRFTNNSSHDMWVAASSATGDLYPAPGTCGQSAFDVCKAIGRGMFYEFTFEEAGSWGYQDNSNPMKTGVVIVE